jgi:hypothetical protein
MPRSSAGFRCRQPPRPPEEKPPELPLDDVPAPEVLESEKEVEEALESAESDPSDVPDTSEESDTSDEKPT